jgi:hypothetical protein
MAILKKRQSKQSLPSFPARETAVRGEMPGLTSEMKKPAIERPVTSTTKPATKPATTAKPARPALTSRVASETAGARPSATLATSTKPALTTKPSAGAKPTTGAGSATSLTTKTSGTTRPALSRTSSSGSGLGNTLKNAAIGAGLGMAGKAVYDSVFGKGSTSGTTKGGSSGTGLKLPGTGGSGLGLKIPGITGGTGLKLPGIINNTGLKIPGITGGTNTKPGTGGTGGTGVKPGAGTGVKPGTGGVTTKTGNPPRTPTGPKPPVTPKGPATPKGPNTPNPPTGPKTPTSGGGAGAGSGAGAGASNTDEDGNTTVTYDDGSTITYDKDGNVVSSTEATDGGTGEVVNADGSTTYTYDDGSTVTLDADGNVVSSTEATDGETSEVVNDDGSTTYTYDDGSTVTLDADGNVIDTADATDITDGDDSDDTDVAGGGYYEDDYGNIYDGNGDLVYDASSGDYTDEYTDYADYTYTDDYGNVYDFDGNLVSESDYSDFDGDVIYGPYEDEIFAEEDEEPEYEEVAYDDYYDYGDPEAKGGGLITLMRSGGGVRHFEEGGYSDTDEEVQDWQNTGYNYGEEDDPGLMAGELTLYPGSRARNTYTRQSSGSGDSLGFGDFSGTDVVDTEMFDDGSYIEYYSDGSSASFDASGDVYQTSSDEGDGTQTITYDDGSSVTYDADGNVVSYTNAIDESGASGTPTQTLGPRPPVAAFSPYSGTGYGDDDTSVFPTTPPTQSQTGNNTVTYDDGSTITYDSNGNVVNYTNAPDESGNTTVTYDDGSTITYDKDGNVVDVTESTDTAITGAGGAGGSSYRTAPDPAAAARERADAAKQKGALASVADFFKNKDLGAAGAGALIGALLGNSSLFGGGGDGAPSIDMSKVGAINPRTTDFGIGAPRFVTYNEYGARDEMPDIYGNELYKNLNAPGFNPVNEGDYGYETPEDEEVQDMMMDEEEQPKMADGGLAQTHFTFGTPVDPLSNITNPQPAQQMQQPMQQQGGLGMAQPMGQQPGQPGQMGQPPMMPQMPKPQMPVQPQQMPQQMRKGGLPALSNVPLAEGRLDFRQGASVHGPGDGQSDDIPAMLADGEYVIDAETVAQIGNGSTKAGAKALDEFRENIRRHKRSAPVNKIPPKTKTLTSYLKKGK